MTDDDDDDDDEIQISDEFDDIFVSEMTCYVSSGTSNPTYSLTRRHELTVVLVITVSG